MKNKIIIIISGITVIIIAGVITCFGMSKKNLSETTDFPTVNNIANKKDLSPVTNLLVDKSESTQEQKIIENNDLTIDETEDWQTYKNDLAGFTFKYPQNWEIRNDYFYETAGGSKAEQRTVVLCDKKNETDSIVNCIQINMPQTPSNANTKIIGENRLNLYTDSSEIVHIYEKVVESFQDMKK